MSAIWNDIFIKWKDEEYTIRPTLAFINHLEQRPGNSLTNLIIAAGSEKMGTVRCAELVYDALTFVGADVESVDEVWEAYKGIGAGLTQSATAILYSCLPQPKVEDEASPKKLAPKQKPSKKQTGGKPTA